MIKFIAIAAVAPLLAACARTSILQMTANTAEITVDAAPVCGDTGAQNIAYQDAAIATLRAGYDRFIIGYNAPSEEFSGAINSGFVTGNPSYIEGGSTTTALFQHEDHIYVTMFQPGQPGYSQAVDARKVLGAQWQDKVKSGPPSSC